MVLCGGEGTGGRAFTAVACLGHLWVSFLEKSMKGKCMRYVWSFKKDYFKEKEES
jgi:hypothetical protein